MFRKPAASGMDAVPAAAVHLPSGQGCDVTAPGLFWASGFRLAIMDQFGQP